VRCISDLAPDSQALEFRWQDIEHSGTRDEGGGTQGNLEFIRRTIVIPDDLVLASRDLHRVKGSYLRGGEVVQSGIDVPSVEAGVTFGSVLWGNFGLVKTGMLRVLQLGFSKTFVVVNGTVPDKLNLRDSRDRLEVGVEDRFAVFLGFVIAVTVDIALGVESLGEEDVVIIMRIGVFVGRTFVSLYCSSGERSTFLKSNASCCTSG
jgi:hypothetical protein